MENILFWKKDLFSTKTIVYSKERLIGELKDNIISTQSFGEINGKKYTFKSNVLNNSILIIDLTKGECVGQIRIDTFSSKATLMVDNKDPLFWKSSGLSISNWQIYSDDGLLVENKGSYTNGSIYSFNGYDDLLVLSGITIRNIIQQRLASYIILFLCFVFLILR